MKKYVITITMLVTLCWAAGLMAEPLTITHATAGDFEAEKLAALAGAGKEASEITDLVITGSALFNPTDMTKLNRGNFPNLETLDVSGLTGGMTLQEVVGGIIPNQGLCTLMGKLTEVKLPYLTEIPAYALQKCHNLTTVLIKNQQGELCNLFDKEVTWVKVINKFAFEECRSLEITELPGSVNNMGQTAFKGCYQLDIAGIPNFTKTEIPADAFYDCSLSNFEIPNSVTLIRGNGLRRDVTTGTPLMQRVFTIRKETPPTTTKPAFANNAAVAEATTIKVLKKSLADYTTAWTGTGSNDVGLNFEALTQPVAVAITGEANGTVSYSGDALTDPATADNAADVEAYEGEDLTLTFTPADGYEAIVTVDGQPVTLEGGAYTLAVAQGGHAVAVTFTNTTALSQISSKLDGQATVYTLHGQQLLNIPASQLQSIPAGVYIVKLTNAAETKLLKIKIN